MSWSRPLSTECVRRALGEVPHTDLMQKSPVAAFEGTLVKPRVGLAPILRAGLGMTDAVLSLFPCVAVSIFRICLRRPIAQRGPGISSRLVPRKGQPQSCGMYVVSHLFCVSSYHACNQTTASCRRTRRLTSAMCLTRLSRRAARRARHCK